MGGEVGKAGITHYIINPGLETAKVVLREGVEYSGKSCDGKRPERFERSDGVGLD